MDDRVYWVALNLVRGIGSARFNRLIEYFGSPQEVWEAPTPALYQIGLPKKVINELIEMRAKTDLPALLEKYESKGITLLTPEDASYPHRLKQIEQPPPVLYVLGEITSKDEWAIGIVGTRRLSPYGQQVAEELSRFLAANGVTVVSGLARGIDSIAHRAALDAGGRTIAVLGSGVDQIYPAENRSMAVEMQQSGALISDYPPGTPPEGINFPPRNRIIAGLSIAVVVVEAGRRSGANITAQFAIEQGKEVFAVPGNIYAPQSIGTNKLIQDGAHPLLKPEDLLDTLSLTLVTEHQQARMVLPENATEAAIFGVLGHEPLHVDQIGIQANLPIEEISATLALMELKGMVRQVGGMRYIAIRETRNSYQTKENEQ